MTRQPRTPALLRAILGRLIAASILLVGTAAAAAIAADPASGSGTHGNLAAPLPTAAPIVGDWRVTYGSSSVVTIAGSDATYSMTAKSSVQVVGAACSLPSGTLIATFTGSGASFTGQHGLWRIADCVFSSWAPMTLNLDGATLTATVTGAGEPFVFTRIDTGNAPAGPPPPPSFRDSVATPAEVTLDPVVIGETVAIAAGIIILVPFPGAIFNSTLEANYAEISERLRRLRRRLRSMLERALASVLRRTRRSSTAGAGGFVAASPIVQPSPEVDPDETSWARLWRTPQGVAGFVLLSALLYGALDPTLGFDVASLATVLGLVAGLAVTLLAFGLPTALLYHRNAVRFGVRALPGTLAVGVFCVLITRLTDFHPGYLYGLVVGLVAVTKLTVAVEGRTIAVATACALVASFVAWFGLLLVAPATPPGGDPGLVLITLHTTLAMTVVAGIELATFGMLPIRFLPGAAVLGWNRRVWLVLAGTGVFAFLWILTNPARGYLSDATRTPLLTIVGLLLVFGIGSTAFWAYFRFRSAGAAPS